MKPQSTFRTERRGFAKKLTAIALSASLLLTACEKQPEPAPPSPALWQVENSDGELEGWLFGTIHSLPDNAEWRTDALETAINRSELLVVEVANLDDRDTIAAIFQELASTPDLPELKARVAPEFRRDLALLMAKGGFDNGDFIDTETWAAALTLAQIYSSGEPENGVDRALLAQQKPATELEGARKQLGIFDSLAVEDQQDLLEAVIVESAARRDDSPSDLTEQWRLGNIAALEKETVSGMMADPELRAALLVDRNLEWIDQLVPLMEANGALMVAVGTGHLIGDDGLPRLLAAKGFTVTRIQ